MKKISIISLALVLTLVGCKKINIDFTYSPANPKAGQVVSFTNNSSAGENWLWTFGDNATSMSKSPNKIYKKPGDYVVTLMVDSAKHQTRSKVITVHDTMPTFVASTDSILHYQDVTFKANIYNPFNYALTYQWILPDNCIIQAGTLTSSAITVYFTSVGKVDIQLHITQKETKHEILHSFIVHQSKAPAIVMRKTDKTVYRQRMISERLEQVTQATSEDVYLIEQTCDTMVTFNGTTFYASQMHNAVIGFAGMTIHHMQIDAMAQKWYITTPNGLFVANMNGQYMTPIDANATGALHIDANRNRIYWATNTGLFAMPLVKSKNNQFTTQPMQCNNLDNIDLITVNNTPQ